MHHLLAVEPTQAEVHAIEGRGGEDEDEAGDTDTPLDNEDEEVEMDQFLLKKWGHDDGVSGSQASLPRPAVEANPGLRKKKQQDLAVEILAYSMTASEGASLLPPPQVVQRRTTGTK